MGSDRRGVKELKMEVRMERDKVCYELWRTGTGDVTYVESLLHPPGPPRNPSGPPGGRFLAFFVGSFGFFVGSSSDRLRTLGTHPGPSERRRITRIRPLNAQRPPRTPPSPSTTPDRRRTTRIDSDRRRTTQGDPPRPRQLPKAPVASRSPPEAPAAQRSAPGRPSATLEPQRTPQRPLRPPDDLPERPRALKRPSRAPHSPTTAPKTPR
ncbi:hypothetical protein PGTUg99_004532 [Puccinia graminis f. sp. tritici]|uniref:Uncharacterized protein n=1 Tax=Puccinia graminis f. sp. tritici TaxID=56615 RepID=A0A5B0LR90_PUCGR|nr:hypothetical protein PGTUg99_004532 [Puccinia graminis f. sp. tritici]